MTIVVGVSPDDSGADAVALGAVLSRLIGGRLVLAYVHPPVVDYPSMGNVDSEWADFLHERGTAALDRAAGLLAEGGGPLDCERVMLGHTSVGRGLRQVVADHEASVVVVGPGTQGRDGQVSIGAVAHSLLHDGSAAVALAPEGYRESAQAGIHRLVVGFIDTDESRAAVRTAVRLARPWGIPVALFTAVLRTTRIPTARLGRDPERVVLDVSMERDREAQAAVGRLVAEDLDGFVVQGDTSEEAMAQVDWRDSDLLVMASSGIGAVRRVFMGDTSHKLIRTSTVPVLVLPRDPEGAFAP